MASGDDSGLGKSVSSGIELAAGIGLGVGVGYWIDARHGTHPWGVLIGFFVGFIVGIYLLIKDMFKSGKDKG